ncbi:MAG: EamA family transporter, partial [Patescibacteria group bacterium]
MSKKRLTAYLLLTLTAAIWGIAGPVIKNTLQFIPPFTFLFWRFLLASLIFLPFFIFVA